MPSKANFPVHARVLSIRFFRHLSLPLLLLPGGWMGKSDFLPFARDFSTGRQVFGGVGPGGPGLYRGGLAGFRLDLESSLTPRLTQSYLLIKVMPSFFNSRETDLV